MLEKIREFPESPGVYLMKKDNEIIYVGKAKNLKKRVSSYFNREHEDNKTRELVKKVEKIETRFIPHKNQLNCMNGF